MTTIGVLGGRWRATVSPAGTVTPWDGSAQLGWYIAADDRWHVPEGDPTVRQRRIDGTPVVETRIKVPAGDAVHRVWCVADGGGCTLIEIENDSSLPFAVAFDRPGLVTQRPATDVPIQGISLPPDSVVVPVAHRTIVRVALPHPGASPVALDRLPPALQVARGWTAVIDRAGRLVLPDERVVEDVAATRSELALNGPAGLDEDPVGFLLDAGQVVRMGEQADALVPHVAEAVSRAARLDGTWDRTAALDAAAIVLHRAGEARALRDLARFQGAAPPLPAQAPVGRTLAWQEGRLARPIGDATAELLALGLPTAWLGSSVEIYGLPIGPATTISFALRWHGERPAVLWETDGPVVPLAAPAVAPGWSTAEPKGEALWPAPAPGSFS